MNGQKNGRMDGWRLAEVFEITGSKTKINDFGLLNDTGTPEECIDQTHTEPSVLNRTYRFLFHQFTSLI